MRRLFLIVLFGILGVGVTSAQELDFGLKAGLNYSDFMNVKGTDMSSRTGYQIGAFAGIKLGKIGIQPELLYSQQGAKFDHNKINLNYVNVPILLKYYLVSGLNIQVGPQFGFVVDDNINKVFKGIGEDVKAEKFDLSGLVGVGIDLPFGIRVDGRYNFGLSKTIKANGGVEMIEPKNSLFSIAVGYSFL